MAFDNFDILKESEIYGVYVWSCFEASIDVPFAYDIPPFCACSLAELEWKYIFIKKTDCFIALEKLKCNLNINALVLNTARESRVSVKRGL